MNFKMLKTAIKIYFIPAGNQNTASSRLRVFSLSQSLQKLGFKTLIHQSSPRQLLAEIEKNIEQKNVVVIQKKVTKEILEFVDCAKAKDATIIYDLDDFGVALWYFSQPYYCYQMLRKADLITTDTPERGQWLGRSLVGLNLRVLPNSVDYDPSGPIAMDLQERSPLRLLWFGSSANLHMLIKYAKILDTIPDLKIVICGASTKLIQHLCPRLNLEIIPWNLEQFPKILQGCDLSFLMHDGSRYDRQKSNHKMITSITLGVPALVSKTPDYERAAHLGNIQDAIFSNPQELKIAIEKYRSARARKNYLEKTQGIIWQTYSPTQTALTFIDHLEHYFHDLPQRSPISMTSNSESDRLKVFFSMLVWWWKITDKTIKPLGETVLNLVLAIDEIYLIVKNIFQQKK